MYEDITYEAVLARMISRVDDWAREHGAAVDTREGSLIRTSLAPAAAELKQMYIELDEILDETYADTASRRFLIRRCAERGIYPEAAAKAVRQGVFDIGVPIGARFSLGTLYYTVIAKTAGAAGAEIYKLECETPGNAGNLESGRLLPVDYIQGLASATLAGVIVPGRDEESTGRLRQRYFDSIESDAFGGNVADYRQKIGRLPGVGGVKIYPAWAGGGTVRAVIIDAMFNRPSEALVGDVQAAVDPEQNHGMGLGFAPIGHAVLVEGAGGAVIDVQSRITFQDGWGWPDVKPYAEGAVDRYFAELSEGWHKVGWEHDAGAALVVRASQIEARLLGLDGIIDIAGTTLNGLPQNIILDPDDVPVRGLVSCV